MHSDKIDGFLKKRKTADQAGGQDRISKQHEKGKLTARERINLLPVSYTHLTLPPKA